ncbi:MAG: Crp/Fnr family transcriptional regulator [Treponema sp.]|jgi:CRP-like cAMP-binding protein|nr:Crp/Fnr family transcriptional regulator [Treponema sp.]
MPKALSYSAGSVIYFQNDEADKIFLLQSGSVFLKYFDNTKNEEIQESIQAGEFFGVKSALGHYQREENAHVGNSVTIVIAFNTAEFESFVLNNTALIMKMLKVFSTQLRNVHRQVSSLLSDSDTLDAESGLFKTGDYYYANRRYTHAQYVLQRYLNLYPDGKYTPLAGKRLASIDDILLRQRLKSTAQKVPANSQKK